MPVTDGLGFTVYVEALLARAVEETTPISGAEYLEKIVHLPFRIPAPTLLQVRRFLAESFPALFTARPSPREGRIPEGAARGAFPIGEGDRLPAQARRPDCLICSRPPCRRCRASSSAPPSC